MALVAASVAAIASGGAALADALAGDERPAPHAPPTTETPSDDEPDPTERDRRSDGSEQADDPPHEEPGPAHGGPVEPSDDGDVPALPLGEATHEDDEGDGGDGDGGDGDGDGDDPDTESSDEESDESGSDDPDQSREGETDDDSSGGSRDD